jgi:hypothetical protein
MYLVEYDGDQVILVGADLLDPPATIFISSDGGKWWHPTPYQTADTGNDLLRMAALVVDWIAGPGAKCIGESDEVHCDHTEPVSARELVPDSEAPTKPEIIRFH